MPKDYGL